MWLLTATSSCTHPRSSMRRRSPQGQEQRSRQNRHVRKRVAGWTHLVLGAHDGLGCPLDHPPIAAILHLQAPATFTPRQSTHRFMTSSSLPPCYARGKAASLDLGPSRVIFMLTYASVCPSRNRASTGFWNFSAPYISRIFFFWSSFSLSCSCSNRFLARIACCPHTRM